MSIQHTVSVRVSEPRRISPPGGRHWFPRLCWLPDGSLLQFNATVDDETNALAQENASAGRVSKDGGGAWQEIPMPTRYGFPVTLADGRVRSFSYQQWRGGTLAVGKRSDWRPGQTAWSAEEPYYVHMPLTAIRPKAPGIAGMNFDRTVMLEPDGSLFATLYGHFEGDTRYRAICARSTDDGENWRYLSTIAYDPVINAREGYNEPVVARVKDGSLLAVLRTGGRENPIWQSRSLDNGQTWSAPHNLGVYSVDPELCLMHSGILACSFGRPTVNIMFSLDGSGHEWTTPTTIFSGNSTCYTGLREVAPGRLLLVYDSNPEGSSWQAHDNQVNAVFVDVAIMD